MDRAKLKRELEADEGRLLEAYQDSLGYWTIGVGHLLGVTPRMTSITADECDALYEWDVAIAEADARFLLPEFDTISDTRQRALVNMTLNRGRKRMAESARILPAIKAAAKSGDEADWQKVPFAITGSTWAKQVGARAVRLGRMFATGTDV